MFAPKGQRPDRIIDFADVVDIVSKYKIYKILRVEGYSVSDPSMPLSDDAFGPSSADTHIEWLGGEPPVRPEPEPQGGGA